MALSIDWRHPTVQTLLAHVVARVLVRREEGPSAAEDRLQRLLDRLEAAQARLGLLDRLPGPVPADVAGPVTEVSATLKEALRFAREDGMEHPEVRRRLEDAELILTDLERFGLAPERIRRLPEEEQEAVRSLAPALRRLRQQVVARLQSPADLEEAAAMAGELAAGIRQGRILLPPTPSSGEYSRYAPDMEVATGCIPCGRAHLGALQANLEAALASARGEGMDSRMDSPGVSKRLAAAEEELAALMRYDWTPERIAASPPAERAVLEEFRPAVEKFREALGQVRTETDLERLTESARQLRTAFRRATEMTEGREPDGGQVPAAGV